MGKAIRVFAFDDLDGEDGGTEATRTDVPLAFGTWHGTIDLGDANYKRLADFLAPFLKAGTRAGKVNPGGSSQRGRKKRWFYEGMQRYAAGQGIEIPKAADGKLMYPTGLRRAWEAEIARRGNEQQ